MSLELINRSSNGMFERVARLYAAYCQALIAIGIRGASVLAGAAVTWFVSHYYGAEANGQFAIVNQTAIFLSVVALFGLDISVIRHFSAAIARKLPLSRSIFLRTGAIASALLVGVGLLTFLSRDLLAGRVFAGSIPTAFVALIVVITFGRGGARLFGAILRSQGEYASGQIIEALVIPGIVCLVLFSASGLSLEEILILNAAVGLLAMAAGFGLSFRHTSRGESVAPELGALVRSALPLWGVGVIANLSDWYGLTVAANLLGTSDAGFYRVAVQVTMVMQVISLSLFNVYTPKISAAFHGGSLREVGALTRSATILSALCALPIALALLAFAKPILALFGPEFTSATSVLRILVVGQLAFTLTGPCGLTMSMAGHERVNLTFNVISIVLLLVLVPVATTYWKLNGLATCISVTVMIKNIASLVWIRGRFGLNVVTGNLSERK